MERALDDDELWLAFNAAKLPAQDWTHRAHLRVAWLFLKRHSLDEAHVLMRVGIIRLNAFHGLVETPSRGYHETLTRLWLLLIGSLMKTAEAASSDAFVEANLASLGKDAALRHYSRDLLFSARARARFVEPDQAPVPAPDAREALALATIRARRVKADIRLSPRGLKVWLERQSS